MSSAPGRRTLDVDILQLRQLYVKYANNSNIPVGYTIQADGSGGTLWSKVASFQTISTGNKYYTVNSGDNTLRVSSLGLTAVDINQTYSTLTIQAIPPNVGIVDTVPYIVESAASNMPGANYFQFGTSISTLKLLGVGDIQLSSITGQNAVFFQISSFSAAGYSTISGELFQNVPQYLSTLSTGIGFGGGGLAAYTATTGSDWATSAPTTIGAALDRLAAAINLAFTSGGLIQGPA